MTEIAIKCEALGKQYWVGERDSYKALRDVLTDAAASPFRRLRASFDRRKSVEGNGVFRRSSVAGHSRYESASPRRSKQPDSAFWALDGVSLNVEAGEVVGVIGRNGAGKSTLLKILSRITKPTRGHAEIRGRVGSLLEVGTGFHPELTGRENIYLNAAIIGMRKVEVERKFREIVAFAEVEQFIDTPVKRYSSGMYVRLAFAVAAHMETEVLLVDEVLAVGDAAFQQKCLGKMSHLARHGRTVLFVSHNMAAIKALCDRAVLLDKGKVVRDGKVDEVIDSYFSAGAERLGSRVIPDDAPRLYSTGEAKIRSIQLRDNLDREVDQLYLGQQFRVSVAIEVLSEIREAVIELGIAAMDGTLVTSSISVDGGKPPLFLAKGMHTVSLEIDMVLLPRRYSFLIGIHHYNGTTIDWIERALSFAVLNVAENGSDNYRWSEVRGYIRPTSLWHVESSSLLDNDPNEAALFSDLIK